MPSGCLARGAGARASVPRGCAVDRAYGAPATHRRALHQRGIRCICPERRDSQRHRLGRGRLGGRPPAFDAQAYKGRNVIERCFNRLKDFLAVATHFDKHGVNFLAGVILASVFFWFG
jgi:transposase